MVFAVVLWPLLLVGPLVVGVVVVVGVYSLSLGSCQVGEVKKLCSIENNWEKVLTFASNCVKVITMNGKIH